MKIVLVGYYGCHNLGDDLFVEQLSRYLTSYPKLKKLSILCRDRYYEASDPRIEYIPAETISKWQRLLLVMQSDYVIWGGGTLDFDSPPLTLERMRRVQAWTGGQFQFWGVGLEKVSTETTPEAIARTQVLRRASYLYLRDPVSHRKAGQLQSDPQRYRLGGDLAFINPDLYSPWCPQQSPDKADRTITKIGFSGKFWWGQGRADFYGEQLRPWIEKYGAVIHCLPAHGGGENNDNKFHEKLKKVLGDDHCIVRDWTTYPEFLTQLQSMDIYISNRLHGAIAADLLGVPNIGIGSEAKIGNYIRKSQMLPELRLVDFMEPLDPDRMLALVQQYRRPDEFIAAESQAAQQAIAQALS